MDSNFIKTIQQKVVDFLYTLSDNLAVASKDQCSEIARLVGCWVLSERPKCLAYIFKGQLTGTSAHDVLGIKSGESIFLLDPTIWQIFLESESILIGSACNSTQAIDLLVAKYGGSWEMSETIEQCNEGCQAKLLKTIRQNSEES